MTDYWLSKMFFDLQSPAAAAEYRALENNVSFLARRTNPYLLRYFFFAAGMKDDEFIGKLRDG
jgi:hypothetical protein